MKLSRATTYALYGLAHLAGEPPDRFVPLSEIRRRYGVPEKHLAKIFQTLVRAGILRSARGVKGGFALARPARSISPLEIVEILDGPVLEAGCMLARSPCRHAARCAVNTVWIRAQREMLAVMRRATLVDLVERRRIRT